LSLTCQGIAVKGGQEHFKREHALRELLQRVAHGLLPLESFAIGNSIVTREGIREDLILGQISQVGTDFQPHIHCGRHPASDLDLIGFGRLPIDGIGFDSIFHMSLGLVLVLVDCHVLLFQQI